jgi:hypothetical protein
MHDAKVSISSDKICKQLIVYATTNHVTSAERCAALNYVFFRLALSDWRRFSQTWHVLHTRETNQEIMQFEEQIANARFEREGKCVNLRMPCLLSE